jgi:hypothetical protein
MPTDRYTKAVLTIIAGALVYIGAMLSGEPAAAQDMASGPQHQDRAATPQPVIVVGWGTVRRDGQVVVDTVQDGSGIRVNAPLPVAVQATLQRPLPVVVEQGPRPLAVSLGVTRQQPLPVAVTGIKAGAEWDALPTKVEAQPLTRYPGPP